MTSAYSRSPAAYLSGTTTIPTPTVRMFREVDGVRYATPGDRARSSPTAASSSLGRGSACINTGGEKVYPEEVEQALRRHRAVADAAVVGVPDVRWGEMVTALVELAPDAVLDTTLDVSLREHARAELAGYKVPKRFLAVGELPRTVAGKPGLSAPGALAAGS